MQNKIKKHIARAQMYFFEFNLYKKRDCLNNSANIIIYSAPPNIPFSFSNPIKPTSSL